MRKLLGIAAAGAALLVATGTRFASEPGAASPTTILLVRHADRDGDKDALTAAGTARAAELVHVVSKAKIDAVYCTKTARSRKTAAPVAAELKLTLIETEPKDVEGMMKQLLADHRGKTVLVVGHSNTVPMIIAAAGGPKIPDLAENEFDGLFVVTVGAEPGAAATLVNLEYGAPSP